MVEEVISSKEKEVIVELVSEEIQQKFITLNHGENLLYIAEVVEVVVVG